jgi:hypothetical protein
MIPPWGRLELDRVMHPLAEPTIWIAGRANIEESTRVVPSENAPDHRGGCRFDDEVSSASRR